ncbi:MAG: hypothetical protein KGZ65_00025 [Sphingomonadales bacterium]|nr:hypothetical protein [Sphingomonadaceae bacterium]MBS3929592.1 hypothetical protein [Sphingomonadales bacterium]
MLTGTAIGATAEPLRPVEQGCRTVPAAKWNNLLRVNRTVTKRKIDRNKIKRRPVCIAPYRKLKALVYKRVRECKRPDDVVVAGISVFGPPAEGAGGTAYGYSTADPGLAINPYAATTGWNSPRALRWARRLVRVTAAGTKGILRVIDKGPAISGRGIDYTGAGARQVGLNPLNFPTDSIGRAELISRCELRLLGR